MKDAELYRPVCIKPTMHSEVLNWYRVAHPTDDLAQEEMHPRVTFDDIYNALLSGRDVYTVLGGGDSLIRERVFTKLAELQGVDYDVIYNLWLYGTED